MAEGMNGGGEMTLEQLINEIYRLRDLFDTYIKTIDDPREKRKFRIARKLVDLLIDAVD